MREYMFKDFKVYVSAAQRKRRAEKAAARLDKGGSSREPVVVTGSAIARTFWGRSWCANMERYSDFYSRLERGRAYLRSGAVLDLRIARGAVKASVMGSRLYSVQVNISAVPKAQWDALCKRCAGGIDSVVELLQGRLSNAVMEHICSKETGLFPAPREITFDCSCPDWASMCKHVAAVLYGIGARLDTRPELLFALRDVHEKDLIAAAGSGVTTFSSAAGTGKRLDSGNLSALFGVEIAEAAPSSAAGKKARRSAAASPVKKRTKATKSARQERKRG